MLNLPKQLLDKLSSVNDICRTVLDIWTAKLLLDKLSSVNDICRTKCYLQRTAPSSKLDRPAYRVVQRTGPSSVTSVQRTELSSALHRPAYRTFQRTELSSALDRPA